MKYIVMECHFSYAVLLDENGKFLKAANRGYQVGQTVYDPVLVGDYQYRHRPPVLRIIGRIVGLLLLIMAIFLCVRYCNSDEPAASTKAPAASSPTVSGQVTISQDDARAIAIRHAGVAADGVVFESIELDTDDGRYVYELDFTVGSVEYEYEIDANTGTILNFKSEPID